MIQRAIVAFASALGPHITLVFPFASELTVDEIKAHMR